MKVKPFTNGDYRLVLQTKSKNVEVQLYPQLATARNREPVYWIEAPVSVWITGYGSPFWPVHALYRLLQHYGRPFGEYLSPCMRTQLYNDTLQTSLHGRTATSWFSRDICYKCTCMMW